MPIRPVRLFGDPVLTSVADPVTDFDKSLRTLVKDLMETLRDQRGSGLAAPQIGVPLRVFVFDVDGVRGHLVNPVLQFPSDEEQVGPEGCLSMPGLYYDTRRRLHAVGTGVDQHGRPAQVIGTAEVARCLQHETDHLDGVLFLDRLDPAVRRLAMRDIRSAEWGPVKVSPHPIRGLLR